MTGTPAASCTIRFQQALEAALDDGWANLGETHFAFSVQFFALIRRLAQAIATGPRAMPFRDAVVERWGGDSRPFSFSGTRDIETLGIEDRYRLFGLVSNVMEDWPARFVEAATAAGLWWSWATRDNAPLPFAYWEVVQTHLNRSVYSPSLEEVHSAAAYLRRKFPRFTREDLIRLVGESHNVPIVFSNEQRRRRTAFRAFARRHLSMD